MCAVWGESENGDSRMCCQVVHYASKINNIPINKFRQVIQTNWHHVEVKTRQLVP